MKLSIVQKLSLAFIVLVLSSIAIVGGLFYTQTTGLLVKHALQDISESIRDEGGRLRAYIETQHEDVLFLANVPPLQQFIHTRVGGASEHSLRMTLEALYAAQLENKPHYLAIRVVDPQGRERLHVGREGAAIISYGADRLESRVSDEVLYAAFALPAGAIQMSEIQLDRLQGQVINPHREVVHSATPFHDRKTGIVLGVVVLTAEIGHQLNQIQQKVQGHGREIYITNDQGGYLLHPDSSKTYGFDLGKRYRVQEDVPRLAKLFLPDNRDSELILMAGGENHDQVAIYTKIPIEPFRPERYIAVGISQPFAAIVAEQQGVLRGMLIWVVLLAAVGVLLGLLLSLRLSRPIKQITRAVDDFSLGRVTSVTLPLEQGDEIGVLARAFHSMTHQVEESRANLKQLNETLESLVTERTTLLEKSEQSQRTVLQTIADAVITIDEKGLIDSFNPAAEKIFGYQADEVAGQNVSILLPKNERAAHDGYLDRSSLTASRIINLVRDLNGRKKDGSLFPLELNVAPMKLAGRRGFVGVMRDITERKQAEQQLARAYRVQQVVNSLLSVSFSCRSLQEFLARALEIIISSRIISVKQMGSIFLVEPGSSTLVMQGQLNMAPELLQKCARVPFGTCHCGKAAASNQIQFADCIDQRHETTFAGIQPHGHYCVPISANNTLLGVLNLYLEHGHRSSPEESEFLQSIANSLAAIIERKQAEQALNRFKTTLDETMDCVFMFEPDTLKFFYVNQGAMDQVGYGAAELMQMHPFDIKPQFNEEQFRQMIAPMIAGEQPVINFETVHEHRDGHHIPVEIFLQYIAPPGETPRFVAFVRDITERKRIDKMKNEFVSTVSHELRTPLTSIRGALGLVVGGAMGALPEPVGDMLKIASSNTERLLLLINDILDIQKIESGQMAFRFQSLDLLPLIERAIDENRVYGQQYGVQFVITQTVADAWVFADRDRLLQVMANLLSNAAKFSPRGTTVEVSLARHHHHDEHLRISVTDRGPGIPESFQAKLFDKFTQADSSDTRSKGGTGLGLSISKAIIDKHGGEIGFITREGGGTTMYIELPRLREDEPPAIGEVPLS